MKWFNSHVLLHHKILEPIIFQYANAGHTVSVHQRNRAEACRFGIKFAYVLNSGLLNEGTNCTLKVLLDGGWNYGQWLVFQKLPLSNFYALTDHNPTEGLLWHSLHGPHGLSATVHHHSEHCATDPQSCRAPQAPHKANTNTLLYRRLSSPKSFQKNGTKFPATDAK